MAARHEEMAADYGPTDDASARHLARAAALWMSVGEVGRARVCVERASDFSVSDRVACEITYQRARTRLAVDLSPEVSQMMRTAAAECEADAPYRSVLMLIDAVACQLLGGTSDDSAEIAQRAVRVARTVSSHAEALAAAALGAANVFEGSTNQTTDIDLMAMTSLLVGQTQEFPASPQLALVIGDGLIHQGHADQALRWAQWIEDCADTVGDRALVAVPLAHPGRCVTRPGRPRRGRPRCRHGRELAERCEQHTLAAHAFGVLAEADAGHGSYDSNFKQHGGQSRAQRYDRAMSHMKVKDPGNVQTTSRCIRWSAPIPRPGARCCISAAMLQHIRRHDRRRKRAADRLPRRSTSTRPEFTCRFRWGERVPGVLGQSLHPALRDQRLSRPSAHHASHHGLRRYAILTGGGVYAPRIVPIPAEPA